MYTPYLQITNYNYKYGPYAHLEEQEKSSGIEQKPPFGDRK